MKHALSLLGFLLAIALAIVAQPVAADPADIAAASRSVVRVVLLAKDGDEVSLRGHGSGVAIAPDLILTNAHVVAAATEDEDMRIGVVPSQGKTGYFARIHALSRGNDLALLQLTESGSVLPATLYSGVVEDGANVFAVGYPGNVDVAQGLSIGDIVSPSPPVKTQGNVSGGRSSKSFDTILHTAAIAAGNSGGPLFDSCGRVVGLNSFGTEQAGGADSTFYFAVSMREISRFLLAANVKPLSSGIACRSIADLDREEAERNAGARLQGEEQARVEAEKRAAAQATAREQAQLEVISSRENLMALSGLALLLALAATGAGFFYSQKEKRREAKIALAGAGLLLIGAIAAWLSRPSLETIATRAAEIANGGASPAASASAAPGPAPAGKFVCVIDTERSRVTVSPVTDVPLSWSPDGCVNTRTQYGLGADGWSRVLVPNEDDTVTVASFDPKRGAYKTERFLLDKETMANLRAERARFTAPGCGGGEQAARQMGDYQAAIKARLPGTPNERLVYNCRVSEPVDNSAN